MNKMLNSLAVALPVAMITAVLARSSSPSKFKPSPVPPATRITQSFASGLKVYHDPVTHQMIQPPPNVAPNPADKALFKSSHKGLVEEPGTTPAGGFKVDAQGRFRSAVTISVSPDGQPAVQCAKDHSAIR